jgi:hypothetical protein
MIVSELLICVVVAALLAAAMFVLSFNVEPSQDEAYVWYGALRTLEGQVPLRDFRAYEPGRYYWCALWMLFLGDGIVAVRVAAHTFFLLGLWAALAGLRIAGIEWSVAIAAGIVLSVWAPLFQRLFEPSLLMIGFLAGVLVLVYPSPKTFLLAGIVAGSSAIFGVNYGLYLGAALLGLTSLIGWKSMDVTLLWSVGVFMLGIALGLIPLLAMFLFVPGLFKVFYQRRVRAVLVRGSSNLPLALPWPWRPLPLTWSAGLEPVGARFAQLYFFLVPMFSWTVALWAIMSQLEMLRAQSAIVSAGLLGSFALHHAVSRADLPHLAHAMPPLILGLFALFAPFKLGLAALSILFVWGSVVTILRVHPRSIRWRHPELFLRTNDFGDWLWLTRAQVEFYAALRTFMRKQLGPGDSLLATPTLVAVYPLLGLRSPVYDTFCVYPASREEQEPMLREIDGTQVRVALVNNSPLDGRDDLRFSQTHPLVWSRLRADFVSPIMPALSSEHLHLFVRVPG